MKNQQNNKLQPINQSLIGKYSYRFTEKKKDHTASRKKETGKEIKINIDNCMKSKNENCK